MANERGQSGAPGQREPEGGLARAEAAQAALLVRLWDAQLAHRATEIAQLKTELLAAGERVCVLGGRALSSPAAFLPQLRRAKGARPPHRS